ncbi:MAG: Radical protein [Dehalococcoidia bacterium]|nr:Radical protein [Dehalococcoidia bacterium]
MKVVFVFPDTSERAGKFYPGVASLSAYLKKAGHRVGLLHITQPVSRDEYLRALDKESPELVAFSSTTIMFPHVITFAKWTKEHMDVPTICGGVHAILSPEEVIQVVDIDMVCLGEGEEALTELCSKLESKAEITGIRNLWVKGGNGVLHKNPVAPLISNLDSLPFPDREIFDYGETFDMKVARRGIFMASRGCPYRCTYCSNHALKQAYGGKGQYVRFRSVDNVIGEIKEVVRDYPQIEYVGFHDDILPMRKSWFEEFCTKYREKIGLPFEMNCIPNLLNRRIVEMAKLAGCRRINFGIESGNDYIRRRIMNRPVTKEQILQVSSLCHTEGIQISTYNMIGLPFENVRRFLDTVKLNAQVRPANMQLSIFYPFPGTELYEICRKHDFLTKKATDSYFEDSILRLKTITASQIRFLHKRFNLLVRLYASSYKFPKIVSLVVDKSLDMVVLLACWPLLLPITRVLYGAMALAYRVAKGIRRRIQGAL